MATPEFHRFDEIKHLPLRVYNRVVMAHNLSEDFGEKILRQYLELFSDQERKEMYIVQVAIKSKGVEAVRKEVTRSLTLVENGNNE